MARLAALALLLATTLAGPMPAMAQDGAPISVNVNMARVLRISAPAATVIVGNPGVADVTIQDPQTLILTGKSYGQTNLIVLDSRGEPVADTLIEVVQMTAGVMTVYQGQSRTTLACAPVCHVRCVTWSDAAVTRGRVKRSLGMKIFARFAQDESGATAIEYGLIAALISVGIILAATALGNSLGDLFNGISDTLENNMP